MRRTPNEREWKEGLTWYTRLPGKGFAKLPGLLSCFAHIYTPYALDNPLPPVRAYNPAASPPGGPNLRGIRMRRDRMNADNVCTGDAAVEIATASLALTSMWGVGWVAS